MNILGGILLILVGAIILIKAILSDVDLGEQPTSLVGFASGICVLGGIMMCMSGLTPSALDVYQGKTILEITYRDSIAIDSVVVFKK